MDPHDETSNAVAPTRQVGLAALQCELRALFESRPMNRALAEVLQRIGTQLGRVLEQLQQWVSGKDVAGSGLHHVGSPEHARGEAVVDELLGVEDFAARILGGGILGGHREERDRQEPRRQYDRREAHIRGDPDESAEQKLASHGRARRRPAFDEEAQQHERQTRRVGHAGTLDPFADGVLVCCVGKATRLVRFLTGCEKRYEAVARFGFATDTGDPTGQPIGERVQPRLSDADLADAAAQLTGEIDQVPPMYSAKKQGGKKLYELARAGVEVERDPVRVRVNDWELDPFDGERLRFRVTVSVGTYIRVLAEDLGRLAGCPAHLESLRRTSSGEFRVEDALSVGPARDDGPTNEDALASLIPLERVPLPLPDAHLVGVDSLADFIHGRAVVAEGWSRSGEGDELAVRTADGRLAGIARLADDGSLAPSVVLLESAQGD